MQVKLICTRLNCTDPMCDREHVGEDVCIHGVPFEEICEDCDEEEEWPESAVNPFAWEGGR